MYQLERAASQGRRFFFLVDLICLIYPDDNTYSKQKRPARLRPNRCRCAEHHRNWNYLAGVGNDPRDRYFNVEKQAAQYDPDGKYVSHWLG